MAKVPISVVIPAYNAERFIRQAIRSVQRQTVQVSEIIVVVDCSTDRTTKFAKEVGATVLEKKDKNIGIAATRNRGILASQYDWIAFLDADDLWNKKKIEYQWKAIQACPDAGIVSCYNRILQSNPTNLFQKGYWINDFRSIKTRIKINRYCSFFPEINREVLSFCGIQTSTVILKRNVFENVGLFDESLPTYEDADLWLRVFRRFSWALVHRKLSWYRSHFNNTVNNVDLLEKSLLFLAEKMRNSPDSYPSGMAELYNEAATQIFIRNAQKSTNLNI